MKNSRDSFFTFCFCLPLEIISEKNLCSTLLISYCLDVIVNIIAFVMIFVTGIAPGSVMPAILSLWIRVLANLAVLVATYRYLNRSEPFLRTSLIWISTVFVALIVHVTHMAMYTISLPNAKSTTEVNDTIDDIVTPFSGLNASSILFIILVFLQFIFFALNFFLGLYVWMAILTQFLNRNSKMRPNLRRILKKVRTKDNWSPRKFRRKMNINLDLNSCII